MLCLQNIGPVQVHDDVLDRSSSFAFSNFELSDVFHNATPSGRFDSADALFRFITPELSIMYGDVKFELSILTEKLLATTEASAGVTDDKLQTCSSNSERSDKSHLSIISRDSDRKESISAVSDASELASGFHDALMQDESSYAELDTDYAESEILGDSDCCEKEYSEHENPSMTSVGCISAQLKVEVLYNESPDGSLHYKPFIQPCADLPSDSTNAEVLRSGMDIEPVNEHIDVVILSGDALGLKSVQMNEKAADPRQVELPLDLQNVQVPVGYAAGSLPGNLSKQISGDVLPDQLIFFGPS
jgi:hypothetical protein